jgi:hypothetical protein
MIVKDKQDRHIKPFKLPWSTERDMARFCYEYIREIYIVYPFLGSVGEEGSYLGQREQKNDSTIAY